MKYPFLNNWVTLKNNEPAGYQVLDCEGKYLFDLQEDIAEFALGLNGRTDPAALREPQEAEKLLLFLEKKDLIRRSRIWKKQRGCLSCTLWIPHITPALQKAATMYHFACKCCLPVLAVGITLLLPVLFSLPQCNENSLWMAGLGGVLVSLLAHEAGHACAAIDYGAPVYEIGLRIEQFLPGAYCAIHTESLRKRAKRVQIYAAGLEANLLLAGVLMILASAFPQAGRALLAAAISSSALAAGNLLFFTGSDGSAILLELLGVSKALESSVSKPAGQALHKSNKAGGALKIACRILQGVRRLPVALFAIMILSIFQEVFACIPDIF